jgi:UDP-glucose 4-epimerase
MRLLVTGAGGFLGANLVAVALAAGHEVVAVVRSGPSDLLCRLGAAAVVVTTELARAEEVRAVIDRWRPDAVAHNAARIPATAQQAPPEFFDDNVRATLNVLEAAAQCGVSHVVLGSTMSVYGVPEHLPVDEGHPTLADTPYGHSKLIAEQYGRWYAERGGPAVTVLRYSGIFGRGQRGGAIPAFVERCRRGAPLLLHSRGTPSSDYVWVDDAAAANLLALAAPCGVGFRVFNIGSGVEQSLESLAYLVRALCGSTSVIELSDEPSLRPFRFAYDIGAARRELGYQPRTPETSLARFLEQLGAADAP